MSTGVAVVMPCHNYGEFVGDAIRSLACQTLLPVDVLVIDDGSTDGTADQLRMLQEELAGVLPLRVVHQENRGLVRTLNEGVAATTAPYVMFVSADDRAVPTMIERLASAIDANSAAGYAYPKMRLFGDEAGVHLTYPFSAGRLIFDHNYIPGAAMVRRRAFDQTGGFRQLAAHEDWDLWLRFLAAGWTGELVPEVLYEWRRHGAARNHNPRSTRLRIRLNIMAEHRRLLIRYGYLAIPFTALSVWRRLRVKVDPSAPYGKARSCWIEAPSDQES